MMPFGSPEVIPVLEKLILCQSLVTFYLINESRDIRLVREDPNVKL